MFFGSRVLSYKKVSSFLYNFKDTFVIFGNNYFIHRAFILPIFIANKLYMKKIFTLFTIGMLFTISTEAKSINKFNFVSINTIVDSIPAQFPGGKEAWVEYLNSKLNYNVPINNNAPSGQYPITFSFMIDKEGNITNIVFDNDPGYGIKEEVNRVLSNKKMPKWSPASINGEPKTYRHKQRLTFSVS